MELFSDSALSDSLISIPQLGILSPTGDLESPIEENILNWGYFLLFTKTIRSRQAANRV